MCVSVRMTFIMLNIRMILMFLDAVHGLFFMFYLRTLRTVYGMEFYSAFAKEVLGTPNLNMIEA